MKIGDQGNEHNSNWHWYSRNYNDDYCYRTHNSIWNICCSFIVRLAAFAVGSLVGKWLALDLPDIIRERQHKKENVASAAAREQEKLLRERLKERYKNDIYS